VSAYDWFGSLVFLPIGFAWAGRSRRCSGRRRPSWAPRSSWSRPSLPRSACL